MDFLAVKSKLHNQWLHPIAGESEAGRSRAGSCFGQKQPQDNPRLDWHTRDLLRLLAEECGSGAKLCDGFPAQGGVILTREVIRLRLSRCNLRLTNNWPENVSYSFIIVSIRAYSWERSTTSTKGLPERLLLTT